MPPSIHSSPHILTQRSINGARPSFGPFHPLKRSHSLTMHHESGDSLLLPANGGNTRQNVLEDRRQARSKDLYARSERMIAGLFGTARDSSEARGAQQVKPSAHEECTFGSSAKAAITPKRSARTINEDDYGDEEEDEEQVQVVSPLQAKGNAELAHTGGVSLSKSTSFFKPPLDRRSTASSGEQAKGSEDVRKKLEQKKTAENVARDSFYTIFYTLENDRDAMLDQQKLDELDRQVENEMAGHGGRNNQVNGSNDAQHGALSSANLGASSLTLKHLISRIDSKRNQIQASNAQLRSLLSEVRKNRSKWASEDKVGQEELYEAAETVLMELKAMTEYAAPFLQKVRKQDAPDYHHIIKHPMDIGTMIKKLKQLQYKSKKEFVDDLDLIWSNCLKYNATLEHPLRKKAEHMKKETARLTPLIPDVVVKDRAEMEAEERRLHMGEFEADDGEDSDEEPIIATRGRKAPSKKSKKGLEPVRKAPARVEEPTPDPEPVSGPPAVDSLDVLAHLKNEHLRADAETGTEGSQHDLLTPPPGNLTPHGTNGFGGSTGHGSQIDISELDGLHASLSGVGLAQTEEPDQEDEDYKTWKQVTKKDRARAAAERYRLFKADGLNPEEPALLRTKACMRRWLRHQTLGFATETLAETAIPLDKAADTAQATTLAEGMSGEEERQLPDYYDPVSAMPQLPPKLSWVEDAEGAVIDPKEEFLRLLPRGQFTLPPSSLTAKMEANVRQMQETRKVVAKIGIVKQMQLQAQTYQNQFHKYEPEPFREDDPGPIVVSDDGPAMSPWTCRAAFQRGVGRIFYHAGFEEFQPSALEAITEEAIHFFTNLVRSLRVYHEAPMVFTTLSAHANQPTASKTKPKPVANGVKPSAVTNSDGQNQCTLQPRFSAESAILHALNESGLDVESLESYIKDDIERLSARLNTQHLRIKDHLAELLRPALDVGTAGADGAGAFCDGSDQFVGGDFAEDIGDDFFGFRELGLDKEFGLASLSVPLHLLQSRVHAAFQPASANAAATAGIVMQPPPPWLPITRENVDEQIGIVRDFFRQKLERSGAEALVEDEELPAKQRFPKPRLGPTGKISSPRKRPIREQQQMARKKRRMEIEAERQAEREREAEANGVTVNGVGHHDKIATPAPAAVNGQNNEADAAGALLPLKRKSLPRSISKLRLEVPQEDDKDDGDPEKMPNESGGSATGLLSPESLPIAAH